MTIVSGITLFVIIWWMVFFCALPVGMRQPDAQAGEHRVAGEMPGAPVQHNLKRKALWVTVISLGLWLLIYWLVRLEVYSFR
jgi:predicted secreted protein